ncbi:MAG: hypothetical protein ACLGHG_09420 [Gammaproteobacteria bacterium]
MKCRHKQNNNQSTRMSTDQTRDFLLFRVQGQNFALPAHAIA